MRRSAALLLVLAACVIGACGDDGTAKSDAKPVATQTPKPPNGY